MEQKDAQSGRDMTSAAFDPTIEHLFGDFALFVQEHMLEDPTIKMDAFPKFQEDMNETLKKEVDKSEEHIIDLLDRTILNTEKLSESDRLMKLKHIVSKLKDDLPESFQEAYNHPDPKI